MTPNKFSHRPPDPTRARRYARAFAAIYTVGLIYGSLFPFSNWTIAGPITWPWELRWPSHVSYSDLLTNSLIYIPLGALIAFGFGSGARRKWGLVIATTVLGVGLSAGLETLQGLLARRVASPADLLLNSAGTAVGAIFGVMLDPRTWIMRRLTALKTELVVQDAVGNLALIGFAAWTLGQLAPLVPSLDLGNLRAGLKPLWFVLDGSVNLDLVKTVIYAGSILGLGMLALLVFQRRAWLLFATAVCAVLSLKVPVIGRVLSPEAAVGAVSALVAVAMLSRLPPSGRRYLAVGSVVFAITAAALQPGTGDLRAFNWIPLKGHLANDVIGLMDLAGSLWAPLVLAAVTASATKRISARSVWIGGALYLTWSFLLEWRQVGISGRTPDVTDAILPALTWVISVRYAGARQGQVQTAPTERFGLRRGFALIVFALVGAAAAFAWLPFASAPALVQVTDRRLDQETFPLPDPAALTVPDLPGFRARHPRLPAPTRDEIRIIEQRNPRFLKRHRRQAKGGSGKLESAVLMARIDPGSQDLAVLHTRLLALTPDWRGHQQTQPLTLAYDWLYDQWAPKQKQQLRDKLLEACQFQIDVIREKRLSPYNVYLYNRPLQALIACALALHEDTPEADPIMAFANTYLKHIVMPVWDQIMGENGGWHEGGEYVGIGIGQAIYQIPAMWRHATGEDLFLSLPGIRGFLDFLVYRKRPDGTDFRWGDGGLYRNNVPDRVPLAMEFRHSAAYSMSGKPRFEPSAWPWGPLPDSTLYDREAVRELPLARHFDGLGLIVARSSWAEDATYVTFKAGDNYWSHSHLDQGAFTIYGDGALAIDSGLYGSRYGSDHHLNYSYQSIAHNVVTVTDPDDRIPRPELGEKRPLRPIANDGGQRRIGSGWGIEAAPIDRTEWESKRSTYHTGRILRYWTGDDIVVAIADVTPAYTNAQSGAGTFSHRTRRVETWRRIFAYDRRNDAVVIFDYVQATDPAFRKRWLIHSIEKPELRPDGFVIRSPARGGRSRGLLRGTVVLPESSRMHTIGGKGFEFYVDGKNYTDDGRVWKKLARRPEVEPGEWRLEIQPEEQSQAHRFLVVMQIMGSKSEQRPMRVHAVDDLPSSGVEIIGRERTVRWYFDSQANGLRIEIERQGSVKRHEIRALP